MTTTANDAAIEAAQKAATQSWSTNPSFKDAVNAALTAALPHLSAPQWNAGQLVQRIMRSIDDAVIHGSSAKLAEHIAAEILDLPKDYWQHPSLSAPAAGLSERGTRLDGLRDRIEFGEKFRPLYVDLPLDYAEALLAELDRLAASQKSS